MRTFTVIALFVGLLPAGRAAEPEPGKKPAAPPVVDPQRLARIAWAIADVTEQRHVKPPSRPAILRAVVQGAVAAVPKDLDQRLAKITSADEFATLLRELNGKAVKEPPTAAARSEALRQALSRGLAGIGYFPPEDVKVIKQIRENRYEGTGIQIRVHPKEKLPELVYCFPGGPARRAGAKPGDLIVQVDDVKLAPDDGIRRVVDLLRGDAGTPVTMHVRQPGSAEVRALKMVRGVVPFPTIEGYRRTGETTWDYRPVPESPVAYVRITSIQVSTLHELRQVERQLRDKGFQALVLDLRFSRAERLQDTLLLADGLLDGGLLWRVRDAKGKTRECRADAECLFRGWPIAVLIDGPPKERNGAIHLVGGALLAAALQDNRRAVVVGQAVRFDPREMTFVDLPDQLGAVSLPTALVERGTDADSNEVQPDHVVAAEKAQRDRWFEWRQAQEMEKGGDAKAPDDPQLDKAVKVVQGLRPKADRANFIR